MLKSLIIPIFIMSLITTSFELPHTCDFCNKPAFFIISKWQDYFFGYRMETMFFCKEHLAKFKKLNNKQQNDLIFKRVYYKELDKDKIKHE
jgi:hypothetical protein